MGSSLIWDKLGVHPNPLGPPKAGCLYHISPSSACLFWLWLVLQSVLG